jgi:hypothetical protein
LAQLAIHPQSSADAAPAAEEKEELAETSA